MNSIPTVSVILPVYNGEKYIECALNSVFSQESIHEVIVVDDGSTDLTLAILEQFKDRVRVLKQIRQGAAAARNLGVSTATGEYIAFLDADDIWTPKKIAKQLIVLNSDPSTEMVFGHVEEFSDLDSKGTLPKARGIMPGLSPITLLIRREVFEKVGNFATNWTRGEFIDWHARATERGIRGKVLPDILARRRVHESNSGHCEASERTDYARIVGAALQRRRALETIQLSTPVVLVLFNRPELTSQIFESVRKQKPKRLFIIADGPRRDVATDSEKVSAARRTTENIDWPCEVHRRYSKENLGIKRSYDEGLTWVFSQCEDAIILEDDCLPSPSFFKFSSELLDRYRENEQIMLISGMSIAHSTPGESYHFSRYSLTWGWATWKRAWKHYNGTLIINDAAERDWLASFLPNRTAVDYWHYTFANNAGEDTNWDIAWARSCIKQNGLAIHPAKNLISNIGFGKEATHTKDTRSIFSMLPTSELSFPLQHPSAIEIDRACDKAIEERIFSGNLSKLLLHVREKFQHAKELQAGNG